MISREELFKYKPFQLDKITKEKIFGDIITELSLYHYENCDEYRKICDALNNKKPFIPVRLFKDFELKSVSSENIVKTMTSSGTSGQKVSKIFLDKETAAMQTKVLAAIMSDFTGGKRMPMLIIDNKAVLKDRNMFSARGAGILGFSMFGTDITYALDENMNLDIDTVQKFYEKHKDENIFIFGFTYMIWEFFYKKLLELNITLPKNNGFILHGGGWKKLINQAVSNDEFKQSLAETAGFKRVYNYYGMVEQTGSIFMECEHGRFHTSIYSDINILNYRDFSINSIGEEGYIELMSVIPKSYPGHILLSEDAGILLGEDDCPCGRLGKTFKIIGRIKKAEVRGCSDTFE